MEIRNNKEGLEIIFFMGKDFEKFIQESIGRLEKYVKHYHFAGWDPFDGLNSTVFQLLPLVKNNKWVRLAWLQFF